MNPLDNIIWNTLTTRHAAFGQAHGEARRFVPEVGPLAGFAAPTDKAYDDLAVLAGTGTIALFLPEPFQPRKDWSIEGGAPLYQMVCAKIDFAPVSSKEQILPLGDNDSADMLELASLVKPGPFGTRTHQLGNFFGIRQGGKLVAMSGERMKVPDYTEVSAVCTHPDYLGRGYAAALMSQVISGIIKRGETPFLHVRTDNPRAIDLYERLGFRKRPITHYVILKRQ